MVTEKTSFILYFGYRRPLSLLSDEDRGRLLMALFDYAESGVIPRLDGAAAIAFSFIQDQMDRDASKYAAVCERNRENGARGGRPPKTRESDGNPPKPRKTERFSDQPRKAEDDSEDENENGEDYDSDSDEEEDILKPSLPHIGSDKQKNTCTLADRFDEFWSVYPKKVGKEAARKSWMRIKPTKELHSKILTAIAEAKQSEQWRRDNGRFIPNPATWLNQGRWDDEHIKIGSSDTGSRKGTDWMDLTF